MIRQTVREIVEAQSSIQELQKEIAIAEKKMQTKRVLLSRKATQLKELVGTNAQFCFLLEQNLVALVDARESSSSNDFLKIIPLDCEVD